MRQVHGIAAIGRDPEDMHWFSAEAALALKRNAEVLRFAKDDKVL